MANPLRGEAPIEGSDKILCFDMNALCQAEDLLGVKLPEVMSSLGEGVSFKTLRGLVWAGLQRKHPGTVNDAGDLVSDLGIEPVMKAVEAALTAAFPQGGGENPRKRTGKATG